MAEGYSGWVLMKQGAEAKLYSGKYLGQPTILKERFSKKYRHPALDASLTSQRTKSEARTIMRCRMNGKVVLYTDLLKSSTDSKPHLFTSDSPGIPAPALYLVDMENHKIYMEHFKDSITVRDYIRQVQSDSSVDCIAVLTPLAEKIGNLLGQMHQKGIIHGDLTTSNMLLRGPPEKLDVVLIDFGLSYQDNVTEDKGVDLYVMERAILSTHPNTEPLFETLLNSYKASYGSGSNEVIKKLNEVRMRGRKRTMVG